MHPEGHPELLLKEVAQRYPTHSFEYTGQEDKHNVAVLTLRSRLCRQLQQSFEKVIDRVAVTASGKVMTRQTGAVEEGIFNGGVQCGIV